MAQKQNDIENPQVEPTRHVHELETLYRISQILASDAQQKQTLAEVLDTLDSELGLNRGTVTLLALDSTEIMIEVAHNISLEKSRKVRYQMGEGITGKVIETGKAMIVPKVSKEPLFLNRFERWESAKEDPARTARAALLLFAFQSRSGEK